MNITILPFRLAAAALVLALLSPGLASAQTAQACLASQLRAAGGACANMTICYAKGMKKGADADPSCLRAKSSMLALSFSEAEALATCLVEGQAAPVAAQVAASVQVLATVLHLDGGNCAAKKVLALGKECRGYLRCEAMADGSSTAVSPGCVTLARDALVAAFAKADKKGGCATTGDQSAYETEVMALVDATHALLRGSGTTTTTTTTSTSSSTVTIP